MLQQIDPSEKVSTEVSKLFKDLKINQLLHTANIRKASGIKVQQIFEFLFLLAFLGKKMNRFKIVFIQNRNNKREWLAILTTDTTLEDQEIIRIYGMRWSIEVVFFKSAKSLLKLGSEFQGKSYDMFIAHTTIVFTRYILLEWERRNNHDSRSYGEIFYLFCDEIQDIDYQTAIRQLLFFIAELLGNISKDLSAAIICQVRHWIAGQPAYIRALIPVLNCEI